MVATNAACKLCVLLACVVSFQIIKPGNVEPSKKSWTTKIFWRENVKHENFQIYSKLIVVNTSVCCLNYNWVTCYTLPLAKSIQLASHSCIAIHVFITLPWEFLGIKSQVRRVQDTGFILPISSTIFLCFLVNKALIYAHPWHQAKSFRSDVHEIYGYKNYKFSWE